MNDRIGVVLPTRNPEPLPAYLRIAARADELGLATVWFPEIAGTDALALACAAATVTDRIRLATGVIPVGSRTPPLIAMGAATLQGLSDNRAVLGVGASTPAIVGAWHGRDARRLLDQLEETLRAIGAAWRGEPFDGRWVRSHGFHLTVPDLPMPPLYVAALGPRAQTLGARMADGVVLTLSTREHLAEAARRVGRARLVAYVRIAIDRDPEAAREWMRRELAWYGSSKAYRAHFRRQGFDAEMDAVAAAWAGRDHAAAIAAISDAMCEQLSIVGPPQEARARVQALLDAGVDEVACYFIDAEREGVAGIVDQLDRLAG